VLRARHDAPLSSWRPFTGKRFVSSPPSDAVFPG
jgi:hypothetical protein